MRLGIESRGIVEKVEVYSQPTYLFPRLEWPACSQGISVRVGGWDKAKSGRVDIRRERSCNSTGNENREGSPAAELG